MISPDASDNEPRSDHGSLTEHRAVVDQLMIAGTLNGGDGATSYLFLFQCHGVLIPLFIPSSFFTT